MKAIAVFQGKLKGSYVSFKQDDPFSPVKVSGHIENLAPGKHGFHVHQYGNLLSSDCANCGGHFNPTNLNSHAGDFGNITATQDGYSTFYFTTHKVSLFDGELSARDSRGRGRLGERRAFGLVDHGTFWEAVGLCGGWV